MKSMLSIFAVAALISSAAAHEVSKGPNGGRVVDASPHHIELVVKDKAVSVFVTDADDKPVQVVGFKGLAVLTIGGKAQRIALSPQDGNRIAGTANVTVPPDVRGVVQVTGPDGKTAQGRFH
jgi:hypothetical protein